MIFFIISCYSTIISQLTEKEIKKSVLSVCIFYPLISGLVHAFKSSNLDTTEKLLGALHKKNLATPISPV